MKKADFIAASENLKGSRDLGAQLFCGLLRSAGVTCRLVCSLQPLPFSFSEKATRDKPVPTIPINLLEDDNATSDDDAAVRVIDRSNGPETMTPSRARASMLRRPQFRTQTAREPTHRKNIGPVVIEESPFPIFWVEAWNTATQKWIAVDPLVTKTVGKPSRIEPPMSDPENIMSYVVAFEEG
jgi:xeroderma pigmentosum group C-complementing protein